LSITGNAFRQNTANITGGTWTYGSSDYAIITANRSDVIPYITSASSINLEYGKTFYQVTGATAVNSMTVLSPESKVIIQAGSGGITINNGTIILKGGVNVTIPQFKLIEFVSDGASWIELSRNF